MAEVLRTMWFRRALKGAIHRPSWTLANPNCACSFHPNICGVQRTSWKRLVCRETNHSEHPVPSSAPVLAPCLCETQTFHSYFPCTVSPAFVTCIVSLLVLCSLVQRKQLLLHPTLRTNILTKSMWYQIVFVWTLTVLLWALYNKFVKVWPALSYLSFIWMCDNQRTCSRKTTEKMFIL